MQIFYQTFILFVTDEEKGELLYIVHINVSFINQLSMLLVARFVSLMLNIVLICGETTSHFNISKKKHLFISILCFLTITLLTMTVFLVQCFCANFVNEDPCSLDGDEVCLTIFAVSTSRAWLSFSLL